jgi:L-threonylcarbamoyladenylate synthase
VRLSPHPVAQTLIQAVGRAITATSANLSGQPSASVAAEVFRALGNRVDAILDGGQTAGGLGSTVLDLSSPAPRIIRQGVISQAELVPFLDV